MLVFFGALKTNSLIIAGKKLIVVREKQRHQD
jgi:hypothetical protein